MKNKLRFGLFIFALVFVGLLLWPRYKEKSYVTVIAKMTPAQVHVQEARLEKIIIPPNGTSLSDVEAVYGKSSVNDPSKIVKGKREVLYWLHLLPVPKRGLDFRAMLLMRVENDKTVESGINHWCRAKNRKSIIIPHDAKSRQEYKSIQAQLQAEEGGVLEDLLQIQDRYSQDLKTASWNRPALQTKG